MISIGDAPLRVADVLQIARDGDQVGLAAAAGERIVASHAALRRSVAAGDAVYGVTTGLGAAVDTRLAADDAGHQRAIPLARAVGVGPTASREVVRATMAARVSRIAAGASGASLEMTEALVALLNRGVTPVVPSIGSIGEADLAPLAHVAGVLAGVGEAAFGGDVLPAREALMRAGIVVPDWGPKDGLALVSSNAASVGPAALLVCDAERVLAAALAGAALSFEGFRGSLSPFSPEMAILRPAPLQAESAARLMQLLEGGDLTRPGAARRLQDPLSFRVFASVHGAALNLLEQARAVVEMELNSSDDNPAVTSGTPVPNANFDPTAMALAIEGLGQGLVRAGSCCGGRILRLMSASVSELPRFLAAPGQNGFATVQKTVSALLAQMQHAAAPMPVVVLAAADSVEDYATMATAIVAKTVDIVGSLRRLVGIELMVAAQACDLRPGFRFGVGTGAIYQAVRAVVRRLDVDRPTGREIELLAGMIENGAFG